MYESETKQSESSTIVSLQSNIIDNRSSSVNSELKKAKFEQQSAAVCSVVLSGDAAADSDVPQEASSGIASVGEVCAHACLCLLSIE